MIHLNSLRKLRSEANLTQAELGRLIGVNANTVTQYENGARKPNILLLKKMAEVLHCTTDELLCDVGQV